ncbi:hypothetical protein HU200_039322 [Digitaria exilis]|uniref:At5g58720/SDE5-like UBA-like domain-containing protein n=1 Tax=Digitaria exilis TaxID=1010633 RepID=A0A835BMM7_9POAL|nr:hypothetical protein HU200_039322 [Digitaria exilis]
MDLSHTPTSSSDNETRALNTLLDVFSCSFSLDDIADAYIKAKGDVNKAGDFLTDLQLSLPHINDVETTLSQTDKPVEENSMESSRQPRTLSQIEQAVDEKHMENSDQLRMPEKLQKSSAAFGTVSSMLGKESARATTTANRSSKKDKPLKVELPEYMRDDFKVKSDESDSAPRRETLNNRDVEEFLFCMLGEGFKLSMEVIREVLGSCGYDVKKSMDELMSFSEKGLYKQGESKDTAIQGRSPLLGSTYSLIYCPPPPPIFHHETGIYSAFHNTFLCSTHSSQERVQRSKLQISPGDLIESLFTVPGRLEEEPKLRRYELGANRSRVLDQKPVLKPLDDLSAYSTDFPVKVIIGSKGILSILVLLFFQNSDDDTTLPCMENFCNPFFCFDLSLEPAVNEEDYQNYRRAAKQHWDMMKQYYEKARHSKIIKYMVFICHLCYVLMKLQAADAFRNGNKKEVDYLIQEVSVTLLFWASAVVRWLDWLMRNLLGRLSSPTIDYLKVIIGIDDGSFKMGQKRRKVMKYLEKNSIQWTEEEPHSGNILICINQAGKQHG